MADYVADINASDYLYIKEITVTEKSGEDQTDFPLKLELTSSNFNFNLARSDGLDFRLGEASDGSYIFNMCVMRWDVTNQKATLFFKIPSLLASEVKTLYAYWGNSSDAGISDGDSVDFLLFDHFDSGSLDTTKWSSVGTYNISDSKIRIDNSPYYIQAKNIPLSGIYQWIFENGFYITDSSVSTGYTSVMYRFYGTENNFGVNFYGEGSYDRYHNFLDSGSYGWDNGVDRGLEGDSYHHSVISYHEPTDVLSQGLSERNTLVDYLDTLERQCNGNTRTTYFRVYGRATNGSHCYHDWVLIRKYLGPYEPEFDTSNLYVQYEQINADAIQWGYGSDITDVNFEHTTSSGGDPIKLFDNLTGASYIWCSVDGAAANSQGVDLIINYNTYGNELTDTEYLHYDSGHVTYLNASKLSNEDEDVNDNNIWQGTTTSGWACIDFAAPDINNVGTLMVQGVNSNPNGMIKNYKFEGSYIYHHEFDHEDWKLLAEGQFSQSSGWQSVIFTNDVKYRYYRLKAIDTYGSNIALQEWRMYNYDVSVGKKIVSKLKLKPVTIDSQYIYFPKQIRFYGSNDLYSWTTLINTKNTYTPTDGGWQEHAFDNLVQYYHYKFTVIGNWNDNTGKICIAEWEMMEKSSEAYTYRILAGTTNNFNSIWADSNTTFDSGDFYAVNDALSIVSNDELSDSKTITGDPKDLYVV